LGPLAWVADFSFLFNYFCLTKNLSSSKNSDITCTSQPRAVRLLLHGASVHDREDSGAIRTSRALCKFSY
jgi:hypothetical protein